MWSKEHPYSIRAQQYLSKQYSSQNNKLGALETIITAHKNIPESTGLALQVLQLECNIGRLSKKTINNITGTLESGNLDLSAIDTIGKLISMENQGKCPELSVPDIHKIINALIHNQAFQSSGKQLANLHIIAAFLYRKQGYNQMGQHHENSNALTFKKRVERIF